MVMRDFWRMFWVDKSFAERVTRTVMVGAGSSLVCFGDGTITKIVGVGLMAAAGVIAAGEKNA